MTVANRAESRHPGAPRLTPDREQLKRYLAKGMTQKAIAEQWFLDSGQRVTRNAITMRMKDEKLTPTNPRPRYEELLPWRVKTEHLKHYDARMLRSESRIRSKKKKADTWGDRDWKRVQSWKKQLAEPVPGVAPYGAVVIYDPLTPDGFNWVPRIPEVDGDSLIRTTEVNDMVREQGLKP